MDIQNHEIGYTVLLDAAENIKILINDNQVFDESVSPNKQGRITFKFQEFIVEP